MNIFAPQQNDAVIAAPNGTPLAVAPEKKKSSGVRLPDYLVKTDGYPSIFTEVWITDKMSKNASTPYLSVARYDAQGKRNKTLNLHRDFWGFFAAANGIADIASMDPAITDVERRRYESFHSGLAELLVKHALPYKQSRETVHAQSNSELHAMFS